MCMTSEQAASVQNIPNGVTEQQKGWRSTETPDINTRRVLKHREILKKHCHVTSHLHGKWTDVQWNRIKHQLENHTGQFGHDPLKEHSIKGKIFGNCWGNTFPLNTHWVGSHPSYKASCGHASEAYHSVKVVVWCSLNVMSILGSVFLSKYK